ncbi:unnamed protein product [Trifolium pratense]|uniref:Uncharacterized protein n=1 Tax=Trifolium pratense TaxID=57577 RepID=A0ACB0L9G5_TRIPR|nr:unnamed protein product [Trifolium pratense]
MIDTVTPSTPIFDDDFLVTTQSHIPNSNSSPSSPSSPSSSPTPPPLPPDNNDIVIRKSTRLRSQPSHLNDYVCNLSDAHSKSSSRGMLYPISHFHSCVYLPTSHSKFVLSVNNDIEPSTYKQASLQDCWVQAMNAELHALQQNKTWILVDAPPNVRPIGSTWVYKPAKTPLDPSVKLHQDTSPPFEDIARYRRLVGKLLYLTTTRPNIVFVTQQLSQFLTSPTQVHYDIACRVVKYLKGSPGCGLFFSRTSKLQLLGFTNADSAGCLDTRQSTSGYCFFLGSSMISWHAKKQHTVAQSSSKAEYRALSFAACELQWLAYLLENLRVLCIKPPVLYCDNQSALHIAANPVFHERTKHLEVNCHFVREKLQQEIFKLLPIHTKSQLANFFAPKSFH